MKSVVGLLSLVVLASASHPAPPGPWTLGAWRPTPTKPSFGGTAIQANGGHFWIGKPASAYCPASVPELNCTAYPGGSTVFSGGNDTVFLNVAVPGGQQVYVAPDGALAYTTPHSAFKPEGSLVSGWSRAISEAGGAPVVLGFQNLLTMACAAGEGVYQIYVKLATVEEQSNCTRFEMRTYGASGIVAWEY